MYFLIYSLTSWLAYFFFSRMVFSLQVFVVFPNFFLWLILSFIALWSQNMHSMILIVLYLLRADLCPSMCSVLEDVPCILEKNVYSATLGWNVLNISLKSISSSVSFREIVSLLIFCLDDLSIVVSGVLKSPTIMVLLSVSFFMFVINWCIYLGA